MLRPASQGRQASLAGPSHPLVYGLRSQSVAPAPAASARPTTRRLLKCSQAPFPRDPQNQIQHFNKPHRVIPTRPEKPHSTPVISFIRISAEEAGRRTHSVQAPVGTCSPRHTTKAGKQPNVRRRSLLMPTLRKQERQKRPSPENRVRFFRRNIIKPVLKYPLKKKK